MKQRLIKAKWALAGVLTAMLLGLSVPGGRRLAAQGVLSTLQTIQPVSQAVANWTMNLTQIAGTAIAALTGASTGSEAGMPVRPIMTQRTATGTISAVCSNANINACGANSTVSLNIDGYAGGAILFTNTNLIATLTADWSFDNTNWVQGILVVTNSTGTAPTPASGKDLQVAVVAATSQVWISPVMAVGAKQLRLRAAVFTSGSGTATVFANTTMDVFGLALASQQQGKNVNSAYVDQVGGSDGTTACTVIGVNAACLQPIQLRTTAPAGNELNLLTHDRHSNDWACILSGLGTTKTQCQAAPAAGIRLYVTSFEAQSTTGTASTVQLQFGTGSNCATGSTNLTAVYPTAINTAAPTQFGPLSNGLQPTAANAICATGGSATNTTNLWVQGYFGP